MTLLGGGGKRTGNDKSWRGADREGDALLALLRDVASTSGPIASVFSLSAIEVRQGRHWPLDWLLNERVVSVNTTAAGGNASLMSIG
jgi:RHH-type proline utilization regulon transcriptional repressor/proline dehydrogenase/delta 1-pyrroline-5-carboxylate dehydrogenase